MPLPVTVVCRILIYLLSSPLQQYQQVYTFNRTSFVAGSDPDLHYFYSDDISSINSIYTGWLEYLNSISYTNNYNATDIPDFSQGFKSPCPGRYSYSDGVFLTVIEDLY